MPRSPENSPSYLFGALSTTNIVQNLLEGSFKYSTLWWLNLSVMAFIGLIVIIFLHRLKPTWAVIFTAALVTSRFLGAKLAYTQWCVIIKTGDCIILLAVCYLSNLVLSILAAKTRNNIYRAFSGVLSLPKS